MTHDSDGHGDMADHEWCCDYEGCGEMFHGSGEFGDVWSDARDAGWRCFKGDDGFEHRCPEHVGKG